MPESQEEREREAAEEAHPLTEAERDALTGDADPTPES